MRFLNSIVNEGLSTNEKREEIYNRLGNPIADSKEKVFARFTEIKLNGGELQKHYFITTYNNVPYDPHGIDSHRESNLRTQLKSVSKQTFDYYMMYLKTKNLLYMTRTQRSFLNG